jgi:general secretion pathway protein G
MLRLLHSPWHLMTRSLLPARSPFIQRIAAGSGVTLIELMVTLAILLVLASVAMPMVKMNGKRTRELELRRQLRTVREAIDQFHLDWNRTSNQLVGPLCQANQLTCKEVTSDFGYPKDLETLLEVKLSGVQASTSKVDVKRYLRQIPIDPMTESRDWAKRCYRDDPDASSWCGDDVYDIHTTNEETAIDGTPYNTW